MGKMKFVVSIQCIILIFYCTPAKSQTRDLKLVIPVGHTDFIYSTDLSPDQTKIITSSSDGTLKLWDFRSGLLLKSWIDFKSGSFTASFSNSGRYILTLGTNDSVKIWSSTNGKLLQNLGSYDTRLFGYNERVPFARFSPNDEYIITSGSDVNEAYIWRTSNGSLINVLKSDTLRIKDAKYSHNGKWIVTYSQSGNVAKIWDAEFGKVIHTLVGHKKTIYDVNFSHDDKMIITASGDSTVKLWEINSGKNLLTLTGHKDLVHTAKFDLSGKYIATLSQDKSLKIWDCDTGDLYHNFPNIDGHKLIFSKDSVYVVVETYGFSSKYEWGDRFVLPGKSMIINIKNLKIHEIQGINTIIRNEQNEIITSYDNKLLVHRLESGKLVRSIYGYSERVNKVFTIEDDKYLVIATDSILQIYDNIRYKLINSWKIDGIIGTLNKSANNIISYHSDTLLKISETITGKKLINIKGSFSNLSLVKFSNDDKKIILRYKNGDIRILRLDDLSSAKLYEEFEFTNSPIYSYTGKYIFKLDRRPSLWDSESNKLLWKLPKFHPKIISAVFSKDDKVLLLSLKNSKKRLLSTNTRKSFEELEGGGSNVNSIESYYWPIISIYVNNYLFRTLDYKKFYQNRRIIKFENIETSDDGRLFVTYGNFGPAKVFDVTNNRFLYDFKGQNIDYARFSPDSKYIITAPAWEGKVKIWNAANGSLAKILNYQIIEKDLDRYIRHLSWSNKGEYIFKLCYKDFSDANDCAELWDPKKGSLIFDFTKLDNVINKIIFSKDDKFIVTNSSNYSIKKWNIESRSSSANLTGHTDYINDLKLLNNDNILLTASNDGSVKKWDVVSNKLLLSIIPLEKDDYLIQNTLGYFKGSHQAAKLLHYVTPELNTISFEQLDVRYNRPDLVLQALGSPDTSLVKAYHQAYLKRIKRLGIDTTAFRDELAVPQADFANRNQISYEYTQQKLTLHITGSDSKYPIERFNVWVNEVPLFGSKGISLKPRNQPTLDTTLTIPLSQGTNTIETSVFNANGIESYRLPLVVNYTPTKPDKPKLYFVGIGVSRFQDSTQNLSWSQKDIRDLAKAFKSKHGGAVEIDTLFNQEVTLASVMALKHKLLSTRLEDKVIVAYSGHGLLSDSLDYFLSTSQTDFDKPEKQGSLPYEVLESLLDSIPARQKLLLLDACHSGEVDKEELARLARQQPQLDSTKVLVGQLAPPSKDGKDKAGKKKGTRPALSARRRVGMQSSFELMQELFVNVARSTGATVISAAGGTQYALEQASLENGVFTYSILEYLQGHASCKVSELRQYVNQRVSERTGGMQVPTARSETLLFDWNIW